MHYQLGGNSTSPLPSPPAVSLKNLSACVSQIGRWEPREVASALAMFTFNIRPKSSAPFILSIASAASLRSSYCRNANPLCFSAARRDGGGSALRCRMPTRSRQLCALHPTAENIPGAWGRARVLESSGKLTSVSSPNGANAARRMPSVTLSSRPPVGMIWISSTCSAQRGGHGVHTNV
jgi:hypothetical protein